MAFWAKQAERITWAEPFTEVLDWSNAPFAKWFVGGKLNASYNCVDRHVEAGKGDKVAFYFEGEPGDTRTITYADLHKEVCQAANALTALGVETGDRVAIYMPMIPETVIAMLACARIGAPHTVVFGGFSSTGSRGPDPRLRRPRRDHGRRWLPTGQRSSPQACRRCGAGEVPRRAQRAGGPSYRPGRRLERRPRPVVARVRRKARARSTPPRPSTRSTRSTSCTRAGRPGKPKGILHTTGGYMVGTSYTHWAIFDLKPDTDVYWTAADIGWVTGHSYIVYGPLANGTTSVMYEGTPDTPHKGRWWEIIEKYKVNILYCAPTAIRTFMKWGSEVPAKFDLSSLRLMGSVGEPINPEAYMWYRKEIGGDRCPVVDTWWQTETGMIMISPLPGVTSGKPGSAMKAIPGISAQVVDDAGEPVEKGSGGYLVLTEPWPSMLRTIYGDDQRYKDTYWSRFPNVYFAGDGAKLDEDGDVWLLGRVDDVMNVSGHRLSTTEIESALVSHPKVAEAAVVGANDEMSGQAVVAFVILRENAGDGGPDVVKELRDHVAKEIGAIAKPKSIMVVPELPKTRSGKIMRRLLRDVAENRPAGDSTTLADSSVMDLITSNLASSKADDD